MIEKYGNPDIITESVPFLNEDVIIKVSPIWCKIISNNSLQLHQFLNDALCFQPDGFFYSPQYQSGVWDGFNRLYKMQTHRFRVGMYPRVLSLLKAAGCNITIDTSFEFPIIRELKKTTYKNAEGVDVSLRDYQCNAVKTALEQRVGIIQSPPRSGKTLTTTAIIDNENTYPVIFFVRSKDLANQTHKVFSQNFPNPIGYICDGVCEIADINVVTIQSAFSAYDKKYKTEKGTPVEKGVEKKAEVRNLISSAKRIFMDEVHHLVSSTSGFIFDKCINTTMKIGLSATPFSDKADAVLVEERTGPVIFSISYSELIRKGYLMKPYIYMYKLPKVSVEGSFQSIYKQAVTENMFIRGLIKGIVTILNNKGKSVVVQTEYIQHSKELAEYLCCEHLTGKDSTIKRDEIKEALTSKKILCLVSTLFEEGLDVPTLDYTINLVGGLDNIGVFQKMRSITAHASKTTVGIIDFIHQCKYLSKHSKRRMELYASEPEFYVEIRDVSKLSLKEIFPDFDLS